MFMQSRTWLFLLLSLLQMPGCEAEEKVTLIEELSKLHPNCSLYGHFYAPQVIFVSAPKPAEFGKIAMYQKPTNFGFRLPPCNVNSVNSRTSKLFGELKEVDDFIHGKSESFSGIDTDF